MLIVHHISATHSSLGLIIILTQVIYIQLLFVLQGTRYIERKKMFVEVLKRHIYFIVDNCDSRISFTIGLSKNSHCDSRRRECEGTVVDELRMMRSVKGYKQRNITYASVGQFLVSHLKGRAYAGAFECRSGMNMSDD